MPTGRTVSWVERGKKTPTAEHGSFMVDVDKRQRLPIHRVSGHPAPSAEHCAAPGNRGCELAYPAFFFVSFFFFFCFLGPKPQCVEVPRLGVESELQLRAYTTATATPDLSRVCNLHHSSQQLWILNPLRKARDQTCILMGPSWICFCYSTMGTPPAVFSPFFSYYIDVNITFLFFIFIWRHHGT